MPMIGWVVDLVARVPARVQVKLLAAFLTITMLLIMVGAVGLQVLNGVNERTQKLIGLQRKIEADHAARAVNCALALDAYAQSFRDCSQQKGITLGVTRIGAHAGPAIAGNFGGGRFFAYIAYGDTVNVAARLEAANKQLGTRVCVSATLAARVEQFRGRPVGDLILRGKTEALRAFEPLRAEQHADPATKSYLEAFAKLEAGDPGAMAAFAAHVGKHADDQLASFHLKRLLNGASGTQIVMD